MSRPCSAPAGRSGGPTKCCDAGSDRRWREQPGTTLLHGIPSPASRAAIPRPSVWAVSFPRRRRRLYSVSPRHDRTRSRVERSGSRWSGERYGSCHGPFQRPGGHRPACDLRGPRRPPDQLQRLVIPAVGRATWAPARHSEWPGRASSRWRRNSRSGPDGPCRRNPPNIDATFHRRRGRQPVRSTVPIDRFA